MKKLLISLFVGFVGIISFCSADVVFYNGNGDYGSYAGRLGSRETLDFGPAGNILQGYSSFCFNIPEDVSCSYGNNVFNVAKYYCIFNNNSSNIENFYITCTNGIPLTQYVYYYTILPLPSELFGGTCPTCPEVNTGEILSGYILESSIDENYCVSNDLCPENTGNTASWSELVINDIVHQSAPLININIPQEFDWSYTVDENEFDLGISGYNVDTDYIDGIITTQNSKPSTEDFNKIITGLIPLFVPGLVIILFLRFVFKFVKKIF